MKGKHHSDCPRRVARANSWAAPDLGFLVNTEEADERWFSSLVGHVAAVSWPEFSSQGRHVGICILQILLDFWGREEQCGR